MTHHSTSWVAVADGARLLGWVSASEIERASRGATIGELPRSEFVARVSSDTPLREALDVIVTSRSRIAAVVDGDVFAGMITIDQLAEGLET
jgi:CBS domain-containing protein